MQILRNSSVKGRSKRTALRLKLHVHHMLFQASSPFKVVKGPHQICFKVVMGGHAMVSFAPMLWKADIKVSSASKSSNVYDRCQRFILCQSSKMQCQRSIFFPKLVKFNVKALFCSKVFIWNSRGFILLQQPKIMS